MLIMMWLETGDVSGEYVRWLTIFVGLLALALVVQAVAVAFLAVKALAIMNDVKKTFDDTKGRAMPLIAKATELTTTAQAIVGDLVPKIKVISENAVEISHTTRQTIAKLDVTVREAADKASVTFADADARTKVQVARVDGMIATTLAATAELGATINEGIRTPARKIAVMVNQSKHLLETVLDRARALGINVGPVTNAKQDAGARSTRPGR